MRNSLFLFLLTTLFSCTSKKTAEVSKKEASPDRGTFAFDQQFMTRHKSQIVLSDKTGKAKVLVVPEFQARVMTSTANGDYGKSYGWINYKLIESGQVPQHINPVGGEDRFWMGPEGGQYSIFFKKGDPFDFNHWQTPAFIDAEPFEVISSDSTQASFRKKASVTNYHGFTFDFEVERRIQLLDSMAVLKALGISTTVNFVAYQSENVIRNRGNNWKKETGLLSIWILGMFNPSPNSIIILPHDEMTKNAKITTDYFGEIPGDRLQNKPDVLLLKGDGNYRGKIGVAPGIAKNVAGSYDPDHHVLTLIKFDLDKAGDYVNAKWEKQQFPYHGDVVNAYNDGPLKGRKQLGPFFELESSSSVRELRAGESISHKSVTVHFEGDELQLNNIARSVLGVNLRDLRF